MIRTVFRNFIILFSLIIVSCSGGGSDEGGTTGGSGVLTDGGASAASSTESGVSAGKTTLNAFNDFTCTGNWTNRDGALGLKAYSGSGVCKASFPGATGKYRMTVTIQTEYDGRPMYEVSINDKVVKSGMYPLSTSRGCDCPHETWYKECPDRNQVIDVGVHIINNGDTIRFKGDDDYPCGKEHGAYSKWHRMDFTPVK